MLVYELKKILEKIPEDELVLFEDAEGNILDLTIPQREFIVQKCVFEKQNVYDPKYSKNLNGKTSNDSFRRCIIFTGDENNFEGVLGRERHAE